MWKETKIKEHKEMKPLFFEEIQKAYNKLINSNEEYKEITNILFQRVEILEKIAMIGTNDNNEDWLNEEVRMICMLYDVLHYPEKYDIGKRN